MDPTQSSDTRSGQTQEASDRPLDAQGQGIPLGAEWEGDQPGQGDPGMIGALGPEPTPGL
jgi:hypothetical protein